MELATEQDVASIPKIELHVHLGGSVSEATATELARRHGLNPADVPPLEQGRYPDRYTDFSHFLRTLLAVNELIRTPEDVAMVAADFARAQARQGIVYTEVIVTALTHVRSGVEPNELWAALHEGLVAAGPETRIAIVVDAIRDFGPAELESTIRLVEDADAPIVGLALTGIEGTQPAEEFAFIRREADRLGLGVEVHAGEMGPPESIAESLDLLGADRIGHGVAAVNDEALLTRLVRDEVPLDVCPTSNVRIGFYPSLEAHPVASLWRAGANITISSDDPPLMGVTLSDELRTTVRLAGLSRDDLATLQRRAARAAFLPASEQRALEARIDAWLEAGSN